MASAAVSVTATATLIAAKNDRRVELVIFNDSGGTIYWGDDSSVTATTGMPLFNGYTKEFKNHGGNSRFVWRGAVYGITASGTNVVRTLELVDRS